MSPFGTIAKSITTNVLGNRTNNQNLVSLNTLVNLTESKDSVYPMKLNNSSYGINLVKLTRNTYDNRAVILPSNRLSRLMA
jgi:hypothetical protein